MAFKTSLLKTLIVVIPPPKNLLVSKRFAVMTIPPTNCIRLRVAGIYFDENIPFPLIEQQRGVFVLPGRSSPTLDLFGLPVTDPVTILELMEAARVHRAQQPRNLPFTYAFDRRFKELPNKTSMGFLSMISIGHQLEPQIDLSLGNQQRPKGFYHLTETPIPNGVVAWQNYVIRRGANVSSLNNAGVSPPEGLPTKGFTTFDQTVLEAGDTVVWRMVAIRRDPDPRSRPGEEGSNPQKAQSI